MATGLLEVYLIGARGLARAYFFGIDKIDSYVVIHCGNQRHTSKIARDGGSAPRWNQKFTFNVDVEEHIDTLSFTLKDYNTFTQDDYLGKTTIYLKEIIQVGVEKGKVQVGDQNYRVVAKDKTYFGEIHIGLIFTLKEDEFKEQFGGWKQSQL